jgi:hypothetical protein
MIGDFSRGGVISGLSLEEKPEELTSVEPCFSFTFK